MHHRHELPYVRKKRILQDYIGSKENGLQRVRIYIFRPSRLGNKCSEGRSFTESRLHANILFILYNRTKII